MHWLLRFLLKRHYNKHVNEWHYHDRCLFCHMSPSAQDKFWGKK